MDYRHTSREGNDIPIEDEESLLLNESLEESRGLLPKKEKKKKTSKKDTGRFDFVFVCRLLKIFFTKVNFLSYQQFLLFLVVIVVGVGSAFLNYFAANEYSRAMSFIELKDFVSSWNSVGYMFLLFSDLLTQEGLLNYALFYLWRKALTLNLLERYFKNKNYYVILNLRDSSIDNPDQRIHSDVKDFCLNLSMVLVGGIVNLASVILNFVIVIRLNVYWLLLPIIVWPIVSVIVYGFLFTPVSKNVFQKDAFEGDFRFAHARIREHSESMAFYNSEDSEEGRVRSIFKKLLRSLRCLSFKFSLVETCTKIVNNCPQISVLVVILILLFTNTPPFDKLTPEEVSALATLCYLTSQNCTQSMSALFGLSQNLGVVIGNTARIGQMFESMNLIEKTIEKEKQREVVRSQPSSNENEEEDKRESIIFDNVSITTPSGKLLFENMSFKIEKNESLIIMGASGVGKSSILRCLCGLWDYGGDIWMNNIRKSDIFFLPQNPYLINGNLKANIIYPKLTSEVSVSDQKLELLMEMANARYLLSRASLHEENVHWDEKLSLGEMQRIAWARLFFHRPKWAILDESTSALDTENESIVYRNAKKLGINLISVAHRGSVMKYHDFLLKVEQDSFKFEKIDHSKIESPPEFDWKVTAEYKTSPGEIDDSEITNEDDVEKNDRNVGKTGLNWMFIKRFFRFCCCGMMIKKWFEWVYVIIVLIASVVIGLAPLLVILAFADVMQASIDREFNKVIPLMIVGGFGFVAISVGSGFLMFLFAIQGIMFRKNLTEFLHSKYFENRMYFKLNQMDKECDNVDQRICADVDYLTSGFPFRPGISLIESLWVFSVVSVISSVIVGLATSWVVGAYAVVVIISTTLFQLIYMIILSKLRFIQQKREGYLRYSLTRIKEYSEQIAFFGGTEIERKIISEKFGKVLDNQFWLYCALAVNHNLTRFVSGICAPIAFTLLLLSIKYGIINLQGLTPGGILAFVQQTVGLMGNISYALLGSLTSLMHVGQLIGAVGRIGQLVEKIGDIEKQDKEKNQNFSGKRVDTTELGVIGCENLTGMTPNDKTLFRNLTFKLDSTSSCLINGPSGCGKTSFLRMLSGLWEIKIGKIFAPKTTGHNGIFFLPQKPYLILGSLKEQIIYPDRESIVNDDELISILEKVNLRYIFDRFGEDWNVVKEWSTVFSPGEKQRISLARLLYHKPRFAILDECTSSLDEDNEELCYKMIAENGICALSVGHRDTLQSFHEHMLEFDGRAGWTFRKKHWREENEEQIEILE